MAVFRRLSEAEPQMNGASGCRSAASAASSRQVRSARLPLVTAADQRDRPASSRPPPVPVLAAGGVLEDAAGFTFHAPLRLSRSGAASKQGACGGEQPGRGMELFGIDGNPVPDGAVVGTVVAARRRAASLCALADDRSGARRARSASCRGAGRRSRNISRRSATCASAASPSRPSTGAGRAAPTAVCAIRRRATSTASPNTIATSSLHAAGGAARLPAAALSRSPIRPAR